MVRPTANIVFGGQSETSNPVQSEPIDRRIHSCGSAMQRRRKEGIKKDSQERTSPGVSSVITQGLPVPFPISSNRVVWSMMGHGGCVCSPVCAATMQVKKIFSSWRRVEDRQAKLTKYPCTTFIFAEVEGKDVIRKEEGTF